MPKIVDHEERRWDLVRAVWAVIRERGVQGASVRAVARQAGWSPGAVQYYFASQVELLLFALRAVAEVAERRMAAPDLPADPHDRARARLERLLPMDPDAHVATEIWVAFLALIPINAEARALHAADGERVSRLCREVLVSLRIPEPDLETETALLHALFDGLALHAVTTDLPPPRIRDLLHHHLTRLTPTQS